MPASASEPAAERKGRIFGCALLHAGLLSFVLMPFASAARADIFSRLEGSYGVPEDVALSCAQNPEHVRFSPDRSTMVIRMTRPVIDYRGHLRSEARYTVLGHDGSGVALLLEGEDRMTDAGKPVVWIMTPTTGMDGYCWGRTDWPRGRCGRPLSRCLTKVPTG